MSKVVLYSVPAIFYLVTNNIPTLALQYADPMSINLLTNLRILTTAIIFRLLLRKAGFSNAQWLAFALLVLAGVVNSYDNMKTLEDATKVPFFFK